MNENEKKEMIIQVRGLHTFYGERKILEDVSFDVNRGEIFVIIGGSGCGKTTLLKHMAGLLQPSEGSILRDGEDIAHMDEDQLSAIKRKTGIAFQSGALFNSMTVGGNVALPLREYGHVDNDLIEDIVRLKKIIFKHIPAFIVTLLIKTAIIF